MTSTPPSSAPRIGQTAVFYLNTSHPLLSRWRRDCATDGHELTDNSEASPGTLTGDLGKRVLSI